MSSHNSLCQRRAGPHCGAGWSSACTRCMQVRVRVRAEREGRGWGGGEEDGELVNSRMVTSPVDPTGSPQDESHSH